MGQACGPEVPHTRSYRYVLSRTNYLLPHPRTSSSPAWPGEPRLSERLWYKYSQTWDNPYCDNP